jgi:hypothetical protein
MPRCTGPIPWATFAAGDGRQLARLVAGAIARARKDYAMLPAAGLTGAYVHLGDARGVAPSACPTQPFPPADPRPFADKLAKDAGRPLVFWSHRRVATPANPGGTRLVIPTARVDPAVFAKSGDVASFSALPLTAQAPFWKALAVEVARLVAAGWAVRVYTHGREVAWLHVRIRVSRAEK